MRPRLLWVTDELPDPGRGGGSIRQYHLLRRVAEKADVDLLMVGDRLHPELSRVLRRVYTVERPPPPLSRGGPLGTARRRVHNLATLVPGRPPSEVVVNRRVAATLRERLPDLSGYDLVQVEHETLAGILPRHRTSRWAVTIHNLLSVRDRQRAALETRPRTRRLWQADAARAEAWERRIVSGYDVTIAVSEEDAAVLGGRVAVVPNGVDLERFTPTPLPDDPVILFSASFNYEPNIDAATWVCEEILPRVRARLPDARLLLVGRQPDRRLRDLAGRPGVEGRFDVPSVLPHLEESRVALVALRQGSGTRLKALEAMAAGRPVAGTAVGLEGLSLEDGRSASIADRAEDLADRVVELCRDGPLATRMAAEARSVAEARFGWDAVARAYVDQVLICPRAVAAAPAARDRV